MITAVAEEENHLIKEFQQLNNFYPNFYLSKTVELAESNFYL